MSQRRKRNSSAVQVGGLNEFARRKLQALIPLLASDQDGEVVATVHAIRRLLQGAGLDLHDLAAILTAVPEKPPERSPEPVERPWVSVAIGLLKTHTDCPFCLNEAERSFLANLASHNLQPSPKQSDWLARIVSKVTEFHDAA